MGPGAELAPDLLARDLQDLVDGDVEVDAHYGDDQVVHVHARWADGATAQLDVHPRYVDWKDLTARTAKKATGLYTELADKTPAFFVDRGRSYYVMAPGSDQARARLLARGAWYPYRYEVAPGVMVDGYRWDLEEAADAADG